MGLLRDFAEASNDGSFKVTLRAGPAIDVGVQGNGREFAKTHGLVTPKHCFRVSRILLKESYDAKADGPIH
jgi:hypothetical protein